MSIYFFSGDKEEIKALCGVKAMIINEKIAKKVKGKLDSISKKKLSAKALAAKYRRHLEEKVLPVDLKEEYNHFKCLIHSRAANLFYIRNFLLRLSYSSYTRQNIINKNTNPHSIFRDVLRYYIDYGNFYYAACPFIEGQHMINSVRGKKISDAIFFNERIRQAVDCMRKYPEKFKENESSYRNIGKLVDRNFCLLIRLKKETFEQLEFDDIIDKKYSKGCHSIFLQCRMFGGLLKRTNLWKSLGSKLLSRIKKTFPYIMRRLFPGSGTASQDSSLLPAIFSKNIVIDPVAFFYEKQTIKSHKKYYPSPLHGGLANLLWHILSRCAVVACFMAQGVPEGLLYLYFKKLRHFFSQEWRDKADKAEYELAHLDAAIIEKVTELCGKDTRFSPWKRIADIEKVAIAIFKEYRFKEHGEKPFFDFTVPSSPHSTALNCAYMHI